MAINTIELTSQECITIFSALCSYIADRDAQISMNQSEYERTLNPKCLANIEASKDLKARALALRAKF